MDERNERLFGRARRLDPNGAEGLHDVPGLDATLPVATVQGDGRKGSAILRACAVLPKGPGCATRRRSLWAARMRLWQTSKGPLCGPIAGKPAPTGNVPSLK
ncbi:protein of unknown function [Pseudomonas sp. JV551A1]|nr:protein of unknown function [Pseudomonas sp. JV551A1]